MGKVGNSDDLVSTVSDTKGQFHPVWNLYTGRIWCTTQNFGTRAGAQFKLPAFGTQLVHT